MPAIQETAMNATMIAELSSNHRSPEGLVALLAIVTMVAISGWRLLSRWSNTPPTPDPWDAEMGAGRATAEAAPLCHQCLQPHTDGLDFCPACGAPVGQYTNYLPFPYLFSVGHALRVGTSGTFRRSKLTVAGFLVFSLLEYVIFAPVYWFIFLRRLGKPASPPAGEPPPSPPPSGSVI
jgi:hypothetical protein